MKYIMRWTYVFPLRSQLVSEIIATGVRTDLRFKEVHLNIVVKALFEFSGQEMVSNHAYDHHIRKFKKS
jgi:hypothetical protein